MFIPRTLSSAAETSIATSSHSFNFSSSSSGFIRSSQPSDNTTILAGSTTSTSYSTTVSHTFTSISLASTKKAESGSETDPSKVASATAAVSRTSGSSLSPVKQTVLKPTMTAKSATQTESSVAVNSPSPDGSSPSSTATKSRSASASTSFSDVKTSVSATSSGPSSTHSGAISQSSSKSPAHATSVAVTKPNTGPTSTSTITDQPFSTFSTPVAVTLINSSNGESATTVPLFLTSVGTSTNSDGSTIVYTHVIANPTGSFSSGSEMNQASFLRKPGEVIGTFLAVGVILAALIGCAIYLLRRRQRRQHRDHTRVSINWPPVDPGFSLSDLPEVPPMRTISIDVRKKPSVVWGPRPSSIAESSFADPPRSLSVHTPSEPRGIGLAGVGAGGILIDQNVGPFGDLHAVPERGETTTGLAVTTSQEVVRMRTYSYTPSSPSLYPESMKTADEDADSLYEREMGISTQDSHVDPSHISEYRPLTPPASVSSGSSSVTPTTRLSITTRPVWSEGTEIPSLREPQMGVLTKRSLLNIRSVTPQK